MMTSLNHLKSIGIENFRVFKDLTSFELAPITILTGKNNSGKSSLLKLLILLKNSFQDTKDFDILNFRSEKHNLGIFNGAVNWSRENDPISLVLPISISCIKEECFVKFIFYPKDSKENGKLAAFSIFTNSGFLFEFREGLRIEDVENQPEIINDYHGWEIKNLKINFDLLKQIVVVKQPENNPVDFLSNEYQRKADVETYQLSMKLQSGFTSFFEEKNVMPIILNELEINPSPFKVLSNGINVTKEHPDLLEKFEKNFLKDFYERGNDFPVETYELWQPTKCFDWFLETLPKKDFKVKLKGEELQVGFSEYGGAIIEKLFKEIFNDSFKMLSGVFGNLEYLTSQRGNSERIISNIDKHLDINSVVVNFKDSFPDRSLDPKEFVNQYLEKFEIGESIEIERIEGVASRVFLYRKGKKILLSDLGYGYSQLLPILLKIRILSTNYETDPKTGSVFYPAKLILLEEPESNLHPDFQSKLADLFVEASERFNLQFIIETHSEYLIRKLQYLTAKKRIKPRDTAIYYFTNPERLNEGEEQVRKIEIREDGILKQKFGSGFFDESIILTKDLLNTIKDN